MKTLSRLITAILLIGSANHVWAQSSPLVEQGKVIEEETNTPVEGATIVLIPSRQSAITDEQGRFILKANARQSDSFRISVIGYAPRTISYADFKNANSVVSLNRQTAELSAVTISMQAGEQFRPISKTDIKMRGINNSQEVLPIVPGLFIGQHAGGGKAEQIFLRGFDIDHGTDIHLTVDGMPVNMVSHAHGQGYADLHFVIPELVENVQFNKGPYYAEKGNLATTGFVDFRTRNTLSQNMLKLEGGLFNTWRGVGMVDLLSKKMQDKNQHAYIASEYMYTDGYFEHPQHFNRLNVFGKYYGKLNERNTLSFSASTFHSKWKASGQIPERAVNGGLISFFGAIDPNEGGNTSRTNINARLLTSLSNGNYITNQVYYTAYDFELYSNFTFFNIDPVNGDQIKQKEKRNLAGYNGSYTDVRYAGNTKLTTEVGASARFDKTEDSELSRTVNRTEVVERIKLGDIKELNTALYLDETIRFSERFSVNAGVRYDQFNMQYRDELNNDEVSKANAGIWSPKLNFYYYPSSKTEIYLTTGRGFHSNDTRVAVQTNGREVLPAAYGSDLGVVLKPARNLLLNAAVWYLYLEQEFVYVGDEGIVEPSGKTRRLGVDLSVRYQPVRWLFIDMDANYCRGRSIDEPKGADRIPLAPVFTSAGGVTYRNKTGLSAAIRYRYMHDRPANEDNSIIAKGYFINDLVVNYARGSFEFGVSVQNLFDVRWKETQFDTESRLMNEPQPVSEIHFTPGTPFFVKLGVTYHFGRK
ncbi:MAG TPA: TonB-dependent receptor [Chitinophagaceae bacterium]|nr:TonB-dependent receptor [Chitinophagaceae bacterium]